MFRKKKRSKFFFRLRRKSPFLFRYRKELYEKGLRKEFWAFWEKRLFRKREKLKGWYLRMEKKCRKEWERKMDEKYSFFKEVINWKSSFDSSIGSDLKKYFASLWFDWKTVWKLESRMKSFWEPFPQRIKWKWKGLRNEKSRLPKLFHLNDVLNCWVTFKVTQNNAFLTAINGKGEVLLWQSAGTSGFRGPRRSTPYACQVTGRKFALRLVRALREPGRSRKDLLLVGLILREGLRRKSRLLLKTFVKTLKRTRRFRLDKNYPDLRIAGLIRRERIAHNGVRGKKRRRV